MVEQSQVAKSKQLINQFKNLHNDKE